MPREDASGTFTVHQASSGFEYLSLLKRSCIGFWALFRPLLALLTLFRKFAPWPASKLCDDDRSTFAFLSAAMELQSNVLLFTVSIRPVRQWLRMLEGPSLWLHGSQILLRRRSATVM